MKLNITTDIASDGHAKLVKDASGKVLYKVRVQDTDPHFEFNARMRREIGKEAVTRKGSWALPIANIPILDYINLVRKNPELRAKDPKVRSQAWFDTLRQIGNEKYRTVNKNLIPGTTDIDAGSILPRVTEDK